MSACDSPPPEKGGEGRHGYVSAISERSPSDLLHDEAKGGMAENDGLLGLFGGLEMRHLERYAHRPGPRQAAR